MVTDDFIREAMGFLGQMRFSPTRGAYAEGRHVSVTIDPVLEKGGAGLTVGMVCLPLEFASPDWSCLLVTVESDDGGERVSAARRFGSQGAAIFANLPPRSYAVHAFEGMICSESDYNAETGDVRSIYQSIDGASHARLRSRQNTIELAVQTEDEALGGREVAFSMLERTSGRVAAEATVRLQPATSRLFPTSTSTPSWMAVWQQRGRVPPELEMGFQVKGRP